jgi:hypothetical protein
MSTPKAAYYLNEEEAPQTGTRLTVVYNRTRWRDGRVAVWLSTQRGIGRGDGSLRSCLRFPYRHSRRHYG